MKKRILGTVIITVIALVAGWNFNQNENEVTISELALANVEALASGESDADFTARTGCVAVLEDINCHGKDGNTHRFARKQ